MSEKSEIHPVNSGKNDRLIDDDTIEKLRQYYNIEDQGEILRFVKKNVGSIRPKSKETLSQARAETD